MNDILEQFEEAKKKCLKLILSELSIKFLIILFFIITGPVLIAKIINSNFVLKCFTKK
jgi:hypothetical protein